MTPEATLAVGTKEMPGFGEQMRQISLRFVPTAILSRQTAVIRETLDHAALVMNLPTSAGPLPLMTKSAAACSDAMTVR